MLRNIVPINEDTCDGCGLRASACHEGAIGLVDGKAHLLRDDCCNGLDDCLPACPADAIIIVQREAVAYDEAAVIQAIMERAKAEYHASIPAQEYPHLRQNVSSVHRAIRASKASHSSTSTTRTSTDARPSCLSQ